MKKKPIDAAKAYEIKKALVAMKLTKEDSSAGKVLDNLYVGGVGSAYNKEVLTQLGITHILTVANKI